MVAGSSPAWPTIQFVLEPDSLRKRVRVRFLFAGDSEEGLLGTVNEQRQGIIMVMVSCLLCYMARLGAIAAYVRTEGAVHLWRGVRTHVRSETTKFLFIIRWKKIAQYGILEQEGRHTGGDNMKKAILTITLIMLIVLTGCSNTTNSVSQTNSSAESSDSAMQTAYDTSLDARTFTDSLLKEMLSKQGITDYAIDTTTGGFITSDPVIYMVGYRYTHNGQTDVYGYKLSQSKDGFEVIAEGTEIGEVIIGTID